MPRCLVAGPVALAVLAATAQAQTTPVCSDMIATGERIRCNEDAASTDDIKIHASGLTLETTADEESGITASHAGEGTIVIESRSNSITTAGQYSHGIEATHSGGTGDIFLRVSYTDIRTNRSGEDASTHGVLGRTTASGRLNAVVTGGRITTLGDNSNGILLEHNYAGSGAAGPVTLDVGGGIMIETSGTGAFGVYATRRSDGNIRLTLRNAAIRTTGRLAHGVWASEVYNSDVNIAGEFRIDLLGGVHIIATGENAAGVAVEASGDDPSVRTDLTVTARGDNSIMTEGDGSSARGVGAQHIGNGGGDVLVDLQGLSIITLGSAADGIAATNTGPGDVDVILSGGSVTTRGVGAIGVLASTNGVGDIRIFSRNHRIVTESTAVDATSQVTGSHGIEVGRYGRGDIVIDLQGGSIETRGIRSYGVHAYNLQVENGGDIRIRTGGGHVIITTGEGAHGILARNFGTSAGTGAIFIDVGGSVRADGVDAHGIAVGELDADAVSGASPRDEDGYRQQTVRANGRVFGGSGDGAGIFMAGGGRVFIGPRGVVGALSGIAIRATGNTVVDGQTVARKLLVHLTPEGRSPASLLDGTIVNDGGETVYAVNGTPLYDTEEGGRTGRWAPNGARDVTLVEGFTGLDFSSVDSFKDRYAPRAAVYEALTAVLLRFDEEAGGERLRRPGSPHWLRFSGGFGSYGPRSATVGGRYRYIRYAMEAGMDFRLGDGVDGWAGVRLVEGTARISSPAGAGRIAATGYGLVGGLASHGDNGIYTAGRLSLTHYSADLSSSARGGLKDGAGGLAHAVNLETGRRFDLDERTSLTARAWLNSAGVSMGRFNDAVGSRVSVRKANRLRAGIGAAAETAFALNGGVDSLVFGGALGTERTLSEKSAVAVFDERLEAGDPAPRLLLDAGVTWRRGNLALHASTNARGMLSRDAEYGGQLELRIAF